MIMSFVLFLGFIGFAFYFFSPFQSGRTLDSSLDYAFDEVVGATETTLESYSIVLGSEYGGDHITISGSLGGKLMVVNREGVQLEHYGLAGNDICFIYLDRFITIHFNEEFSTEPGGCSFLIDDDDFDISSSENKSVISRNKMLYLNNSYYDDYSPLKEDFNLPGRIDFGFSLIFDEGDNLESIVGENEIPTNLEVISKEDRVEVVTENGIVFADLVVKVW